MTLFSDDIRLVRIFAGVSWEGCETTVGLPTTAIFSVLAGYFYENFRDEAAVII